MKITPAKANGSTKECLLSLNLHLSCFAVNTVFPSYFGNETQILRESSVLKRPENRTAGLHFASLLLPSPLARQVV